MLTTNNIPATWAFTAIPYYDNSNVISATPYDNSNVIANEPSEVIQKLDILLKKFDGKFEEIILTEEELIYLLKGNIINKGKINIRAQKVWKDILKKAGRCYDELENTIK